MKRRNNKLGMPATLINVEEGTRAEYREERKDGAEIVAVSRLNKEGRSERGRFRGRCIAHANAKQKKSADAMGRFGFQW